jgi:thioredoxin 1
MATIDINADSFEQTITDNEIVLVDFWADWCGPCKRFAPIYDKASDEHSEITFAKLDTDANQALSGQLGIEGIPTLMAFREGVLVFNQAGALPGPALQQVIDAVKGLDMEEVHNRSPTCRRSTGTSNTPPTGCGPVAAPASVQVPGVVEPDQGPRPVTRRGVLVLPVGDARVRRREGRAYTGRTQTQRQVERRLHHATVGDRHDAFALVAGEEAGQGGTGAGDEGGPALTAR